MQNYAGQKVGAMNKRSATNTADEDSASTSKRFRAAVDESASHFVCAITQELPLEPVTAEDGNVYERTARGVASHAAEEPVDQQADGHEAAPRTPGQVDARDDGQERRDQW